MSGFFNWRESIISSEAEIYRQAFLAIFNGEFDFLAFVQGLKTAALDSRMKPKPFDSLNHFTKPVILLDIDNTSTYLSLTAKKGFAQNLINNDKETQKEELSTDNT
ncbi:hypothetical protein RF11_02186 [Thelohanellus kitauei]|uniref:Uncharacterized protein n=1 Tax=Thelohanellus kitauei TaxID=669202 RepID=A0A0C2IGU1_THEKT|nr:hypothetical protein RF11_02186 [Thelohanellus kitauei]